MKKIILGIAILLSTAPLFAQGFTFGGRYSNYSTDLDVDLLSVKTGRESSIGLVGDYRNAQFVLRGQYDHDLQGGISVGLLPINFADYTRNRFEITAGWAPIPVVDLEAGVRLENYTVGGFNFFGSSFATDLDLKHQAIVGGINVHTATIRPVGFYGSARGYVGSADFQVAGADVSSDTTGYKVEAGVPIAVGVTGWEVTPGVEYDHVQTDKYNVEFNTNRFFINFAYTFGR